MAFVRSSTLKLQPCARDALTAAAAARVSSPRGKDRDFTAGDVVSIELAPGNVLRAALIVYGLPLAGAAAGAALAYAFALGDAGAAGAAIGGLLAGALGGRRRLRDETCLARFTPTVTRRGAVIP